jgi:hypothetical protein
VVDFSFVISKKPFTVKHYNVIMNTKNGGAKMIDLYVKNGKGVDVQPRFYQAITAKKAIDLENKSFGMDVS